MFAMIFLVVFIFWSLKNRVNVEVGIQQDITIDGDGKVVTKKKRKTMTNFKLIAIFLVVLLAIFILHGIFIAISIFTYLLKYMIIGGVIAWLIYRFKFKNK